MNNKEIENLPKYKKSEANVNIQLAQLVRVANQLGLWEAADAVEKMFENSPSPEFGCFIDAYKDDGKWHEIYKTCIMDDGNYSSCIYASENGRKEQCKYWRETTFLKIDN